MPDRVPGLALRVAGRGRSRWIRMAPTGSIPQPGVAEGGRSVIAAEHHGRLVDRVVRHRRKAARRNGHGGLLAPGCPAPDPGIGQGGADGRRAAEQDNLAVGGIERHGRRLPSARIARTGDVRPVGAVPTPSVVQIREG